MAYYFFDSSALVKRYVNERGSEKVLTITDPDATNTLHIARITIVEVVAAVARRRRGGNIVPTDAATVIADFDFDVNNQYRIIEITQSLLQNARNLANKHALRGYDAVQLTAAIAVNTECITIELPSVVFVSSDNELNAAAKSEGLQVENPTPTN